VLWKEYKNFLVIEIEELSITKRLLTSKRIKNRKMKKLLREEKKRVMKRMSMMKFTRRKTILNIQLLLRKFVFIVLKEK
jgi:hypothetical protein